MVGSLFVRFSLSISITAAAPTEPWLTQHLPGALVRPAFAGLAVWQVLLVPLALVAAFFVAVLLGKATRAAAVRVASRTSHAWDDKLIERLGGPLTLVWLVVLMFCAKPFLALPEHADATLIHGLRGVALAALFWGLARGVEVARVGLASSPWLATRPGARGLLPVISRIAQVIILAFAMLALLAEFGFPVASIIAGLGIGGLAVALAAQKTVENVFGAFSIGADQPFREGDFVKVEDFVGTVERIGLRSTRIRTLDRTVISLPNGRLADMRVESYTARERMRLATIIGLVYETTPEQMRTVLRELEATLRAHPKIWTEAVIVRFAAFNQSSLDIEVMAWFQTADWGEFQLMRQEILLQFMEVVAGAGTSFAYPTQTIHLAP